MAGQTNMSPILHKKEMEISKPQLDKTSAFLQVYTDLKLKSAKPLFETFFPEDLPDQLWRNLFITSIITSPFTVMFQYQGMYITDQLRQDFVGKVLTKDLFGDAFSDIERLYQMMCQEEKPVLSRELVMSSNGISRLNEVIHTPFYDQSGKVSHICGVIETIDIPEQQEKGSDYIPADWDVEFSGTVEII